MEEPSSHPAKTFTVTEANALLPKVQPLVQQLHGLRRSIARTDEQLNQLVAQLAEGNGHPIQALREQIEQFTAHQLQLAEAFKSALTQLEDIGGVLKDLDMGLVDFYSLREGELIFLCWKSGEDQIRFWHTLEEGYAGRKLLE